MVHGLVALSAGLSTLDTRTKCHRTIAEFEVLKTLASFKVPAAELRRSEAPTNGYTFARPRI